MFKISYSPDLRWEIEVPSSKNAWLPIVAANYCADNKIHLVNKPDIRDIKELEEIYEIAQSESTDYYNLTNAKVQRIRASILLIPYGLLRYGKVKFTGSGGCKIWKRPLDTFDNAFIQAGVDVRYEDEKIYQRIAKPKKNIMLLEFSVTATESLLTYLAFLTDVDYEINIYQAAIEPHVINTIEFLRNLWADITVHFDHRVSIRPRPLQIKSDSFTIISDYIQAGTYFAIWAGADNAEIIINNCNVDDLSAIYWVSTKIWINFKILDKKTIKVNSFNKKNYKATKIQTQTYPGFPTDLQSLFWTLLTQCDWISKIFETLFEWRFWYLNELENLGAHIEILNPHQAIVIWKTQLKWGYVSSTDLRWWWAMVLAGIMAEGETFITKEDIILRWYENIVWKLQAIGVKMQRIE